MGCAQRTGTASRRTSPSSDPAAAESGGPDRLRQRRTRGGHGRRAGALLAAGAVVLGLAGLTACSPDDDAKAAASAPSTTAATSPSTSPTGAAGQSKHGTPRFTVGADGVTSWNPDDLSRQHTTKIVHYPMVPPVGGDHAPIWLNCNGSVYTKPVPDVNAVHALEHGAVWVTYTSKAAPADVQKLTSLVARTPYSLMSPYPGQKAPIMLTAWGKQRTVKSADDPAVNAFFSAFVQGPQTPEPGAPCTNGLAQ